MSNRIVEILNNHCDHWKSLIPMLESGVITTGEVRDGNRVDTTLQTLAETQKLLTETQELLSKIEARDA